MRVGIIGAGIGGLIAAVALLQKGSDILLFEKAAGIEAVGAGIALAPNAMQVFRKLNLFEEVKSAGVSMDYFLIANNKLESLQKVSPGVFKSDEKLGLSIGRAALHELLFHKIPQDKVYLNHHYRSFERSGDQITIHFENQPDQTVDFLIGADGIHSLVRQQLFPEARLIHARQICWRGLISSEHTIPPVSTEAWGKGKRFGFSPIDEHTIYWYALVNADTLPAQWDQQYIADQLHDYHSKVKQMILDTKLNRIVLHPIQELKPLKSWSDDRVVLIGDAAHAMTPNMGQGACQAIIDAYTLAEVFNRQEPLSALYRLRKREVTRIVTMSRYIGRIAQADSLWFVNLRNTILKLAQPLIRLMRL